MQKIIINLFFIFFSGAVCTAQLKPEFRGVWVATVDNIDWPNRGVFNSDEQKAEFIELLNMHKRNGLNAIIMQIRPAADAFYPSQYEPWSQWLTGLQGKPPTPYYDPLEFMITETHKRGMSFHAWMNPYRAEYSIGSAVMAPTHITRLHPEWFLVYGDKKYFDPGSTAVRQYVAEIVKDVVSRYAVDAIHFDDYFYPYRLPGKEFPDNNSYLQNGKGLSKDDWRRSNTDSIIALLSKVIKATNKKCQFGISPFGIWRNQYQDSINGSKTHGGVTNYDDLYANILLWLKSGWIDYVAPQIYWEIGHPRADYSALTDWWNSHSYGKHCYIGLGIYKANTSKEWRDATLIPREIKLLRTKPNVQGMIFFSSASFKNNPNGWSDSLRLNYFKDSVGVPAMEWIK